MIVKRMNRWPVLLALMPLFAACGGGAEQETLTVDDQSTATQEERMRKTKKIFYNIPSPMETAGLLKDAGADYDGKILNDVKNVDRYTSASKQALNLGVYGADLSYASVFNHTQESMFYTSCSKKLADKLGVSHAFNDSTIEVMQKNQNDREALLDVISETYWSVDAYLKENDRENISALMVTGGWVEGLYIATQVAAVKATPELRQRIAEQKLSLNHLSGLLNSYTTPDPALDAARADVEKLTAVFADVELPMGDGGTTEENGVTVVGGTAPAATLTDAQLAAIRETVTAIRNNYIN
jgi:hypothetical protein